MKIRQSYAIISSITMSLLAILACNMPQESPTPEIEMGVAQTQTAIAIEKVLSTATTTIQFSTFPTVTATSAVQTPAASPTWAATMVSQSNCTDRAKFIGENIPDDSVFAPGESFVKTWTLANVGTCAWTPEYSLVFVNGEQMGGTSPYPIGQTVPVNGEILIYLPQTAPQMPGEHQGFWKLRNARGEDFGLGNQADVAFWVKILTVPGSEDSGGETNLGQPTWIDNFEKKSSTFYLGKDEDISFDIQGGNLVMTAFEQAGDQWRIAEVGYLDDFYLEAKFRTGPNCSGKDSYGVIVRAPDKPNGIIDSGFVFGFSCEGKYRAYRMNNGNYSGIEGWTGSSSINPGPDQDNWMGIMAKGDTYTLFANGFEIFEFTDPAYTSGLFGLMIRSDTTEDLKILVKEIAYWKQD